MKTQIQSKPTKTINRLHFEDLDPHRFEDMCFEIVKEKLPNWYCRNFGRSGSDEGIDIQATSNDNGKETIWVFQCKRHKNQLTIEIDNYIQKHEKLPDKYIFMLGRPISKAIENDIQKYAKQKEISIEIWDSTTLESLLFNNYPGILRKYFDTDIDTDMNEKKIQQRLSLKKRLELELSPLYYDHNIRRKIIIRSIDDNTYPEATENQLNTFSWCWLEYYKPYYKGIAFFSNIVAVCINTNKQTWSLCDYNEKMPANCIRISAYKVVGIPYENIIDFDIEGDEYYSYPHIYCKFNSSNTEYEAPWYVPVEKNIVIKLNKDFTVLLTWI